MTADDDYFALLDRAKDQLPEVVESHERFTVPDMDIFQEGKTTVIRNFVDVTDALRREPQQVLHFLMKELGAPGNLEGRRAVLKAKIMPNTVAERIVSYTETFVICSECGRPDTKMTKEGRTMVLQCEACGSHRPVNVRKGPRFDASASLKAGDVIELSIDDIGRKGDGMGRYQDYIVIVPGTARGAQVNVKITNISSRTAFGNVTNEAATR
ncbi:MAG: translation initiation factor IF-2 subunit beta [Thermoplasmatales archaeon]|nr:translation initiation factor IF-2 subunit beta [Thermoplasmatales archaeon]